MRRARGLSCMDHFCSALKFCVHKGPFSTNSSLTAHQLEPHNEPLPKGRSSLSQPGSQETKPRPQFSLARRPQRCCPASPQVTPCIVLAQSHARCSWRGSAGLTVPRRLREGSDCVLVRRTGKGRQQRVKTGFLTHGST